MSDPVGPVVSVRGAASQTVAPDCVILDASITASRGSKVEAVGASARSLAALTADLAALGGVPLSVDTERRPLTWSAQSATTEIERDYDNVKGQSKPTGQIIATVSLGLAVRDFGILDALGTVLAGHADLGVHQVGWSVDADNPAWPRVRADAIHAAIAKGRDYAEALGGSLHRVEHIADVGLLGGGEDHRLGGLTPMSAMRARAGHGGGEPDTPSLDPVPQELTATIEARFTATGVSLAAD